jgi:DNA-directed RNA polymerase I, II, and III subunit RPABC1
MSLNLDQLSPEEQSRLYKVWKTLNEMMEDRGYEKNKNANMNKEEFIQEFSKQAKLNGVFIKIDPNNPDNVFRTYFEYNPDPKLNMDTIKNLVEFMKSFNKINSGILISAGKLTQQAKLRIMEINTHIPVETFSIGELVVNITKHVLVPKHILLKPEEKDQLLKRYRIKPSQLPKIYITDPVAKYLGLKRGDVVKIVRFSETAGKYITYRIAC